MSGARRRGRPGATQRDRRSPGKVHSCVVFVGRQVESGEAGTDIVGARGAEVGVKTQGCCQCRRATPPPSPLAARPSGHGTIQPARGRPLVTCPFCSRLSTVGQFSALRRLPAGPRFRRLSWMAYPTASSAGEPMPASGAGGVAVVGDGGPGLRAMPALVVVTEAVWWASSASVCSHAVDGPPRDQLRRRDHVRSVRVGWNSASDPMLRCHAKSAWTCR
jgi:hypothetical protein